MENDAETSILIVDDHYAMREGVKQILSANGEQRRFGEASNSQEALTALSSGGWDVVILDIGLPGRSGLDVLREIKKSWAKVPTIVFSMHDEEQFAVRALRLGAASYLRKEGLQEDLTKAVAAALKGQKYLTAKVSEKLAVQLQDDRKGEVYESLSNREFQILGLIANGQTVKEIGGTLDLSPKTVSTYRTRILQKLRLKNNSQLMQYAVRHSLVDVRAETGRAL